MLVSARFLWVTRVIVVTGPVRGLHAHNRQNARKGYGGKELVQTHCRAGVADVGPQERRISPPPRTSLRRSMSASSSVRPRNYPDDRDRHRSQQTAQNRDQRPASSSETGELFALSRSPCSCRYLRYPRILRVLKFTVRPPANHPVCVGIRERPPDRKLETSETQTPRIRAVTGKPGFAMRRVRTPSSDFGDLSPGVRMLCTEFNGPPSRAS